MEELQFVGLRNAVLQLLEELDHAKPFLVARQAPAAHLEGDNGNASLTVEAVSEEYGVSQSYVRKHLGEIPHYRIGNNRRSPIRFRRKELDEHFSKLQAV